MRSHSPASDRWAEALDAATSLEDAAGVVGDHMLRLIGCHTATVYPFRSAVMDPGDLHIYGQLADTSWEIWNDHARQVEDTFASFASVYSRSDRIEDFRRFMSTSELRKTRIYGEHLVPLRIERQLVGFMGSLARPQGLLAVGRTERERPFTPEDRASLARTRDLAERSLLRFEARRSAPDAGLLRTLADGLRIRAFVFDARGRVVWMTRRALVSPPSFALGRLGDAPMMAELEELRRIARLALERSPELERRCRRYERAHLRLSARLMVERVAEAGMPPHVVAAVLDREASPRDWGERLASLDLGPREAEVAALAAQGFSNLNIALRLGISENTVRTHLKRAYRKLGVATRTELVLRLTG